MSNKRKLENCAAPNSGGDPSVSRRRLDLIKERDCFENGSVVLSCRLISNHAEPRRIWFELPEKFSHMATSSMDPFLLAVIFYCMQEPTDVYVHGQVSGALLRNLTEFQSAWNCWLPEKYVPAEIFPESIYDLCPLNNNKAVTAFSGGVDSTYTVWSRTMGGVSELEAGLFIHGFDIPLQQGLQFDRAAGVARETLADAGMELICMKCNLYEPDWEMSHGAAIAACLTLLKGYFSRGIIAATFSYDKLHLPWGSNPLTDYLLSSHDFTVVHDGASVKREQKEARLFDWKVGYNNLRVCYEAVDRDKNCCRCGKCLMLYCSLQSQRLSMPASFGEQMCPERLLECTNLNAVFAQVFDMMVDKYGARGFENEAWFQALKRCARFNRVRLMLEEPELNGFANWLRKMRLQRHLRSGP